MKKNILRAVIEVGFIIFLFYSNLLMGEFERSGMGQKKGMDWAIADVFTVANFEIAAIAALITNVATPTTAPSMSHSNKDGASSAESEEGRLLIEENALPSDTYPTQSGSARVPRVGQCADEQYA
jgi:hypothetical protein